MKYTLSYQQPNRQYIDIEFQAEVNDEDIVLIQLPAWRPGRYQLGNFARNIQKWQAFNEKDQTLSFKKRSKDLWEVDCREAKQLIVRYNYYAAELNAGSTYLDEEQLYVNPVNCLLYLPNRAEEACELELKLEADYQVATAMKGSRKHHFKCRNFDELADQPFIASKSLQKLEYEVEGIKYFIWLQGELKGDKKQLVKDFKAFSEEQNKLFGEQPFEDYHFLFHILPYRAYHGVEHCDSTVICLGPTYEVLKKDKRYDDLLGVSSHELFHAWNVKRIRPAEMWPYDFSKENYSRLGYLTEGATTWYGDLMLYRSKVFDDASFLTTFDQLMNRHFNNPGVNNLSVADSSFDSWLDGYEKGVPNRKSSIYTEGALITFLLDVEIRKQNNNQRSFDDVLRTFYTDFYKQDKGVSESDYQRTVEKYANKDLDEFFTKYVNGSEDILPLLEKGLDYLGFKLNKATRENYHESYLGFVCDDDQKVLMIYPDSVAEKAGLSIDDQILAVNDRPVKGDLSQWCEYYSDSGLSLSVIKADAKQKTLKMKASKTLYFAQYSVKRIEKPSADQKQAFELWKKSLV